MSGPEEVDRLGEIALGGLRRKMLRPKCLARSLWVDDPSMVLAQRVRDELEEAERALNAVPREFYSDEMDEARDHGLDAEPLVKVFEETCDVAAFGAMLVDPQRWQAYTLDGRDAWRGPRRVA